ncbi:MAG: cyaA 2 [Verrucomicrobia bacterium]|nr:cyaA 2 [Verrucomicrobiota bacterium]
MAFSPFRFRRFSTRLLALVLGLLFATLAVTYLLVSHANLSNALAHSEANLRVGARIYDDAIRRQIAYLTRTAGLMTGDYAIRQVLQAEHPDIRTLSSALQSYTQRVGAPVIAFFDTEGQLLANSDAEMENENVGPFRYLIDRASKADQPEDSGISYLNGKLHVLVVVPLYAPYPNIAGWFGLAFPIDHAFAQKIKDTTGIEVTFASRRGVQATTLSAPDSGIVSQLVARGPGQAGGQVSIVELSDDRYVTLFKPEDLLGEDPVTVVLERPLKAELAAAHELEQRLLYISLVALAVATLLALGLARGVSDPVRRLAGHTKLIAGGDYVTRLQLDRADELGHLADSINAMSTGLAERDQVRDLLDKNVSPEVAAQLMRDGATLGGEEREVTILFADLRGFTTLSERLAPPELLALLNRYLDRMSAEIERHGGVIDKFIGDAIMALFGAPVAQGDSAGRALAAARGMEAALAGLNAELAAEGRPPLAIGVGINTARVVAGNIGSHRRLNYSVIGDGVNVAARLQALTRTPEYRTNIITSAATLAAAGPGAFATRPLGAVNVKGRVGAVEIHAVE